MKKKRKLNGPQILGLVLVGLFVLWNIAWGINVLAVYLPYRNKIPKSEIPGFRVLTIDGYDCSVKLPDYLSFTGNLAIVNQETQEGLVIWPHIFGDDVFGVRLSPSEDMKGIQNVFSYNEIYVDRNGNPTGRLNGPEAEEICGQKQDTIQALFEICKQVWKLP